MKDNLKALNKKLLIKSMKTLLFIIPISIITNNLYIWMYGDYIVSYSITELINFAGNDSNKFIFSTISFCLIFIISYDLETTILPFLFNLYNGKISKKRIDLIDEKSNKILPKSKQKIWEKVSKKRISKDDIYATLMVYPVLIVLFLIAINNIWSYISIIAVFIVSVFSFKTINSIMDKYKIQ